MKHLYFVRHGESELNVQRVFAGQLDTPLTDRGREQARVAAEQARGLGIDAIVSSPLIRALETAQIIARSIGYSADRIIVNNVFKERFLGELQGKSWDTFDEDATDDNGAETDEALLERAGAGLALLREIEADTVLLVGHGSFSKALRQAIDPHNIYDEPANAEIVQLI